MKPDSPVKDTRADLWTLAVSVSLQLVTVLQFHLMKSMILSSGLFTWQLHFIIAVSLAVTTLGFIVPAFRTAGLIIKLVLLFLISYPLGAYIWLSLIFLVSLLVEEGLNHTYPVNLIYMGGIIIYSLLLQQPRSAFYMSQPGPELHDRLLFISIALVVFFLLALVSAGRKQLEEERKLSAHLDRALNSISRANLDFQSYSTGLQLDTLVKERKRVSREIHDTVGYSLTNIRIMLEAAAMMIEDDREQAAQLIEKSMKEAGICLEETRAAMRLLRSKEIRRPRGLRAFFELVTIFSEATGISVNVEFGNSPDSFGPFLDKAVFRFIQEGLTNSFRHGRASEIRIYFWVNTDELKVSLQDNGRGAENLKKGIGITGMQERLSELGGSILFQNITDGFEVSMRVPLEKEEPFLEEAEDDPGFAG